MVPEPFQQHPHRRLNPLTGEWVLVSPQRRARPWLGAEEVVAESRPAYDPNCHLCPGNARANGERNPDYTGTYVFANDFAALEPERKRTEVTGLFRAEPVAGECRVICFSPRHDLTLAEMSVAEIEAVVVAWRNEAAELGMRWRWVQIFENKGAAMGCSNPHPHGQVWASDFLPTEIAREDEAQGRYFAEHRTALLSDIVAAETGGERVIAENQDWLLIVPFWAVWPFESLLICKHQVAHVTDICDEMTRSLSDILKEGLVRYDRLFGASFPYTMGWHGAPSGAESVHWRLHAHFFPPLLRSATVRKFMVGYEMLAEAQRDLTPEEAATRLREILI